MSTLDLEKAHRWFAVEYNNRTWDLLGKEDRSEEENEEMIHHAHASLLHWQHSGGEQINALRAYYLLTNAYAAAGEGEPAMRYGARSLALLKEEPHGITDWDNAFIYDAVGRANAAAGNTAAAHEYKEQARRAGEIIANEEDRKIFNATFQSGNWHGIE